MKDDTNLFRYYKKEYINVPEFQYHYIKDITVFDTPHISRGELSDCHFKRTDALYKKTNKEIFTVPDCEEENLKFNLFFEDLRRLKTNNKKIIIFEEVNSIELELSYIVLVMDKEQRVSRFSV